MSERICTSVQEDIAWARPLSEEHQRHVLSCAECERVALEFEKLDSRLGLHFDVEVPAGFADRVMARIRAEDAQPARGDWFAGWAAKIVAALELRPVQVGAASVGFLFTVGNLMRFVFSLLAATTA